MIAGIVLAVAFLGGPSQKDYNEALEQLNEVTRIESDLESNIMLMSSSNTEANLEDRAGAVRDSLLDLEVAYMDLTDMKAAKSGEGKELFSDYSTKYRAYLDALYGMTRSAEYTKKAEIVCTDLDSVGQDMVVGMQVLADRCGRVVDELAAKASDPDLKSYLESFKKIIQDMQGVYAEIDALQSSSGRDQGRYTRLLDELDRISDEAEQVEERYQAQLQDKYSEVDDFASEFKALGEFLEQKANE